MRLRIVALILTLTPLVTSGQERPPGYYEPPHFTFTGVNLAEKQARWAWLQLPSFLGACYHTSLCELTPDQLKLIEGIFANAANYTQDTLKFKSEKAEPGFFRSERGENHRLVMTGLNPKAPVYVNSDLAVSEGRALGPAGWLGLFAHELVHHLGIDDDARRIPDQFGSAITRAARRFLNVWELSGPTKGLSVWLLSYPTPTTTRFLRGFPKGLMPRLAFVDGEQIYNFSNLDTTMPGRQFCGELPFMTGQISPLNELYEKSPSPGRQRGSVSLDLKINCLDQARQAVGVASSSITFMIEYRETPEGQRFWPEGFIQSQSNDEGLSGTEARVEIAGLRVPESVRAGTDLVIEAELRDLGMARAARSCGARFSRPGWPSFQAGVPFSFYQSSCEILEHAGEIYRVRLTRRIPADADPGEMTVDAICLGPDADPEGACDPAIPSRRVRIEILNPRPPAEFTILKAEIRNATPLKPMPGVKRYYHVRRGQTATVSLTVRGERRFAEAFFESTLISTNDRMSSFTGPLLVPDPFFVKARRMSKVPEGFVLEFDIQVPETFEGGHVTKLLKFHNISLVSESLRVRQIHFGDFDFAIGYSETLPREFL